MIYDLQTSFEINFSIPTKKTNRFERLVIREVHASDFEH